MKADLKLPDSKKKTPNPTNTQAKMRTKYCGL